MMILWVKIVKWENVDGNREVKRKDVYIVRKRYNIEIE